MMPTPERPDSVPAPPAVGTAPQAIAGPTPDRRAFLTRAGVLAGWLPLAGFGAAHASSNCALPPAFPPGISLYRQAFKNWAGDIALDEAWTCAPRTPEEVVQIVNWGRDAGYQVRPRGMMHNWSPLTMAADPPPCAAIVLVDTTRYLTAVTIDDSSAQRSVTAQTGITMEALLARLEAAGLGMTAVPAPGDLTLGGVLAIDGHGTAVPARGEARLAGHTYGSVSNQLLSLTAVVFDATQQRYVLRRFNRNDTEMAPLMVHLGRAFIVEARLQVGANQRLRCQSRMDIAATELFAPQGSGGRTFSSFLDSAGRAEAIWFPFTEFPWLKVWTVAPVKPTFSRRVYSPFNYIFSDNLPREITDLLAAIVQGQAALTPLFGQTQASISALGLASTLSFDLWGWSKDLLLYVKPTTLRVTANGYAVLTRRADVQRTLCEFTSFYQSRLAAWQRNGKYPMNGPVEIRVTGLDQPGDVAVAGAVTPALSAVRPRPDHPEWDVAVWFDILTLPGTPFANAFYREIEQWMLANFSGSHAAVRPEWSKGWGYTDHAAWDDVTMLGYTLPQAYRDGQPAGSRWDDARAALHRHDPYRVFSSPLLDRLLP
ncbi:MAG: FAD-linked oxidase [Rhodoferax sp.]|nr:FAD-linked oxidase [Rhodoferax sp.]